MPSTNPYDELGVAPDATAEQIKTAYREKVMRTHPDRGGNRAEFERVQAAYELLTDPVRKRRFDETGDCGRDDVPTGEQIAQRAFLDVLHSGWPAGDNPVRRIKEVVSEKLAETKQQVRRCTDDIERLERYQRRLRRKQPESPGVLEAVLDNLLIPLRADQRKLETWIARMKESIQVADGYEFGEGTVRIEATSIISGLMSADDPRLCPQCNGRRGRHRNGCTFASFKPQS